MIPRPPRATRTDTLSPSTTPCRSHHVHENGDDQPRLQHHEYEDQRPSEHTLHVTIIDHVGRRAQHEEIAPPFQIDADRVMAVAMFVSGRSEEHTSELQSLMRNSYAVSCWKKKTYRSNIGRSK